MFLRVLSICLLLLISAGSRFADAEDATTSPEDGDDSTFVTSESPICWSVTAEALWLQRASGAPLATSVFCTDPAIDQASAGSTFQPGLRLALQRFDCAGNGWELGYWGLQQWHDNATVWGDPVGQMLFATSPSLRYDDVIGGFNTSVAFTYRARANNVELNHWSTLHENNCWTVRGLRGLRYFNFEEHLNMMGVDSNYGTETLQGAAFNSLIGAQVGFQAERTWDRVSVFTIGKAGLYGNDYHYRMNDIVAAAVFPPMPDININKQGVGIAGLLESQSGLRYFLNDCVSLNVGYTVMYIPGLTLQPTANGPIPGHRDGLFLHGASVGCTICF